MHKATEKRAKKLGVRLVENAKDETVTVSWKRYKFVLPHRPAMALRQMEDVIKFSNNYDYRNMRIELDGRKFRVVTKDGQSLSSGATVKDAISEMPDVDYSDIADAEESAEREFPSLEALQKAKVKYKARGDINNCGDWLALVLKEEFLEEVESDEGQKTEFDVDGFTSCLVANGVPVMRGKSYLPFANRRSRGWQGRFRMNGRQKLEVVVAEKGFVKIGSHRVKAPRAALTVLRQKHPQE